MAPAPTPRAGFTLIEVLMAVAIIALLAALVGVAAHKALTRGTELQNRHDISQLATAVHSFENHFGVRWLPSRIRLREKLDYNLSNAYEADSYQYLTMLFPKLKGPWVDWNGNGTVDPAPVDLEGDQCLVFFLGGIPAGGATPGTVGFSTDPGNPSVWPPSTLTRKGPFFQFRPSRLVDRTGQGFYSYLDSYGLNFVAYFSSYRDLNGYGRYATLFGSDCNGLGVSPYAENLAGTNQYLNPDTFQIVSAGADGRFGRGSLPSWTLAAEGTPTWTAETAGFTPAAWAVQNPPTNPTPAQDMNAGRDDMSNFSTIFLGIAN
jgi:prepilin-type N-terminal cleavage/methylation domain-containing protein